MNSPIHGFKLSRTLAEGDIEVYEGDLEKKKMPCLKCGDKSSWNGKGRMLVRDVSLGDTMIGWLVHPQKYRCKNPNCHETWIQPIPGVDNRHNMTHRLVDFIINHGAEETAASIANDIGIDPKTVATIFTEAAEATLLARTFETPRAIGIDEVHLGRKVHTVIVNIDARTIIEMLPDRKKPTVLEFFEKLQNKEKVKFVAMDPWNTYREVVKATLGGAKIVLDKFHAHMLANNAMERARKHVREDLTESGKKRMKGDRTLLLSLPENLTADQKKALKAILGRFDVLQDCWLKLCDFREIWAAADEEDAKERIANWRSSLHEQDDLPGAAPTASRAEEFFRNVEKTLEKWEAEILAYFCAPIGERTTNAFTEAMNKSIRRMFDAGNGYTFESLRRKVLLSKSCVKKASRTFRVPVFDPNAMILHGGRGAAPTYEEIVVEQNLGIDPGAMAKILSEDWSLGGLGGSPE